ncbi:hypothetical protein niasHT_006360 [Heterodera trifolii]|uniref:Uncharacterized protein n=1 Tax=Heterodera trifolii TaxID=157864 RepID=A0ABD2LQ25_9BILA
MKRSSIGNASDIAAKKVKWSPPEKIKFIHYWTGKVTFAQYWNGGYLPPDPEFANCELNKKVPCAEEKRLDEVVKEEENTGWH